MKTCERCVLTNAHPGVEIDADGVCNRCKRGKSVQPLEQAALKQTIEPFRGEHYDCLVCWSGGKDSTFVVDYLVREMGLRVAAFTFDNTFTAQTALDNLDHIKKELGVYHVLVRPDTQAYRDAVREAFEGLGNVAEDTLFYQGLRRHGPACYMCGIIFHNIALKQAVRLGCPLVATGFTSGQDPAYYADYRGMPDKPQSMLRGVGHWRDLGRAFIHLLKDSKDGVRELFLTDDEAKRAEKIAMFRLFDFVHYDPSVIYERIEQLGWQRPTDTDSCSSNCLLNAVGIQWYQQTFRLSSLCPRNERAGATQGRRSQAGASRSECSTGSRFGRQNRWARRTAKPRSV